MKQNIITFFIFLLLINAAGAMAQCSTTSVPAYSSGCTSEYLTSVLASGAGVTSTISYSGSSCSGSYYNYFTTQGITAPTGSVITMNINRCSGYMAYVSVFIDWNNDGIFQSSELVGTTYTYAVAATAAVYSFTIPELGIVTNTNLHMRVFLGEPSPVNAPCSAHWGETCDYYLDATCTTPTIIVTPPVANLCGSGSANLTASGAGSAPIYSWSPATGLSASTGAAVVATPAANTTYTVTGYGLGVCPATGTAAVLVPTVVPAVIIPSGPTTFCANGSVALFETSGAGVSYQWYSGATPVPGATNNSYVAAPGSVTTTTYSVSVTNATGCVTGTSATVTVLATPVANITADGATTVCSPQSVSLNANSGPGYTYQWYNSGGLIAGATAQNYGAPTSDDYAVAVTSAVGCKDTSVPLFVTVNPSPIAAATASGPLTFCAYDSVVLSSATIPGIAYQWLNGTTPIAGATATSYKANVPGTYDYRLRVTNSYGCSDTTADGLFNVVVNTVPVAAITASGPLTICVDSAVKLSTVPVSGNTYQWYFGGSSTTEMPIPGSYTASLTASATGYYYVAVTTPQGCITTATPANVNVVAIPHITYTTPLSFCWGSSVDLSLGISSSVPGITYQWMNNGNPVPGANTSDFYATTSGNYSCFIDISGGCLATVGTVPVTVNPLPAPVISYADGLLATAAYYTSYQWYMGLSPVVGATGYELHPALNGDYSVIVIDSNHCMSQATSYPLSTLAVGQVAGNDMPVLYPNPATSMLFVRYSEKVTMVISTIDGKKVMERTATNEMDISGLPGGLYTVSLYNAAGAGILVDKLIKQ